MSTDPQWDAAARRRRGQRGQQNVGQAMQGIGSQLFGYLAQQKMLDQQLQAGQQDDANQFTMADLAALGVQGGPLSDVVGDFQMPDGRQNVPVPHGLFPLLRAPYSHEAKLGQIEASGNVGQALAGLKHELNLGRDAIRFDQSSGLIDKRFENQRQRDQEQHVRIRERQAPVQAAREQTEQRLAGAESRRALTSLFDLGQLGAQFGGAEPDFISAAADSVQGGMSEIDAIPAVRAGFMRDILGAGGVQIPMPNGDMIDAGKLFMDGDKIKVKGSLGRSRSLGPDEIGALFRHWQDMKRAESGEEYTLPDWAR